MANEQLYNTKCAGVKRLMKEAAELHEPTEMYYAQPLEDNLFEWHFTVRGTINTEFEGGIYHGRIVFPPEYPMKPPNMMFLTPNGRFELHKKICLSISGYHPETWLPSWSIRTALLALIGFLPTQGGGALGSLEYPKPERQKLAKASLAWKCRECGCVMKDTLKPLTEESEKDSQEASALAEKVQFKAKEPTESKPSTETENENGPVAGDSNSSNVENSENQNFAETSPGNSSETPSASNPAPAQIQTPRFSSNFTNRHHRPSDCDFSLFITIPLFVVIFAIVALLLARRFLLL
ncbi:hypothetical protein WR25_02426 [Diploscapter pachys]|uniref:UBC core domain-containing protein n=1 Tax=Diploscapter pachys TaxID=2018661 RepID=A0A2A2KKT2_9BILA|nr:hypothetical protein WR25_02426 [Diploscapter pachys]